jgi:hypothetical protein
MMLADAAPWPAAMAARADAMLKLRFAEEDLEAPRRGVATYGRCGDGAGVSVPVEIDANGVARFTAGAGCTGLVVAVEPYEPLALAGGLRPGTQSLGEFVLRAAASADVRVVRESNSEPVSGAIVRVTTVDDESRFRPVVLIASATTDENGRTHVSGLPPYRELRVVAETPDGLLSSGAALRLEPRERGLVDPLEVPEPATLVIDAKIDEAVLAQFPSSYVASLIVEPADPARKQEELQQDSIKNWPATFGPLHPGRWVVRGFIIVDGTYSFAEFADLELEPGETRNIDVSVSPAVFAGTTTYEGAGIEGRILVEDRNGGTLYFNSDANGRFRIVLPEKGTYRVSAARMSHQGNVFPIGKIAFTDPSRPIDIEIPKGAEIEVRVRRGEEPAKRVAVKVSRRDESGLDYAQIGYGRLTSDEGEARFQYLPAGKWTLSVQDDVSRSGAEKTITVANRETRTIELELAGAAEISGTVRDSGGALVPRARVDCVYVGPAGNADRGFAISNGEGMFVIDLIAPAPSSALCAIIAPGGGVDAVSVRPGVRSAIRMRGSTGALSISGWKEGGSPESLWLVAPDGRAISVNAVAGKLGQFQPTLTIPALAAGQWRLVRLRSTRDWFALANGVGAALPSIGDVSLRGGTSELIRIPNP